MPNVSVTDGPYCADPTGVINATAAINAAESAVAINGGKLEFPPGTYLVNGLTKKSNVIWQGSGKGATKLLLAPNVTASAVVSTVNAYSLFGSGSLAGQSAFGLRDLCIDGNKANGARADGIGIYGAVYELLQLEVQNCSGTGIRSEYGVPGVVPGGHGYCAQSALRDLLVHDNDNMGIYYCGPSDSVLDGVNIYRNLNYNFFNAGSGACKISNSHVWGSTFDSRQAAYGFLFNAATVATNCHAEGSTSGQVMFGADSCSWIGGLIYDLSQTPNSSYGVVIGGGSPVCNSTLITGINHCDAGAVLFNCDSGYNVIHVSGSCSNPAAFGYSGSPGPSSSISLRIMGAGANSELIASA